MVQRAKLVESGYPVHDGTYNDCCTGAVPRASATLYTPDTRITMNLMLLYFATTTDQHKQPRGASK